MKKKHSNKDYNLYKVQDLIRAYSKLIGCDNPIQKQNFEKVCKFFLYQQVFSIYASLFSCFLKQNHTFALA